MNDLPCACCLQNMQNEMNFAVLVISYYLQRFVL
jgi:hypothetical protein